MNSYSLPILLGINEYLKEAYDLNIVSWIAATENKVIEYFQLNLNFTT